MDMQVIKDLLADDLYDSKDWRDADMAERVEYLIELVAYKNREIDLWLEQIEHVKSRTTFLEEMMKNAMDCIDADDVSGAYDWLIEGFVEPLKESE